MGWNAYQIAFYNSNFKNFISTDVIPDVVRNGNLLQEENIFQGLEPRSVILAELSVELPQA
jgi:hypothetical protein